jgi:hypothetical protein
MSCAFNASVVTTDWAGARSAYRDDRTGFVVEWCFTVIPRTRAAS